MSSLTAIRLRMLLFCFLPVLLLSSAASGQVDSVKDDTSTPVPGVGHDYIKSLVETVNPMNGSLTFRISAPIPPGRGMTVPFSMNYDSNGSMKIINPIPGGHDFAMNQVSGIVNGGWSYSVPTLTIGKTTATAPGEPNNITCDFSINYLYQDAGGGRHSLGLSTYAVDLKSKGNVGDCSQAYTPWGPATIVATSSVSYGADGSIYAAMGTNNLSPSPVNVTQPDGTTAYFSSALTPPMTYVASSVTDRNGNFVTVNGSGITYTDTLGRTALSTSGTFGGPGAAYVSVSGISGSYQLNWSAITWNYDINLVAVQSGYGETGTLDNNSSLLGTVYAVSSISLPDSQSFQFQYDPMYGMVSKITYPSGGYVRYTWGINAQSEVQEWDLSSWGGKNCSPACGVQSYYDTPAVTDRYVSYDGTHEVLHQHFAYTTTWQSNETGDWTSKTTTVTTTDELTGQVTVTNYTYTPNCVPAQPNTTALPCSLIPVESTIVYQDGNGHTLQTVNKAWASPRELVCQQTVLDNGLTSETDWGYNVYEQETEKDEYDYGSGATSCAGGGSGGDGWSKPGPLSRKTVTNYATFSNLYLVDRPSSIIVCNTSAACSSGSSNSVSETDYSYDQTTPTTTSTVQHTSAPGGTQRGNLTTKSEHIFTTSPGSYTLLNTTYVNDDTGQRLSMTDANGNTTSYSYADNYYSGTGTPPGNTNAYLTQVTYPYTHGPNTSGTNHIEKFAYGYTNGQLYQSIDQNSQSTLYKYADAFARPTETDYPDGGKTLISYNDAPPAPTVTTQRLISSGNYLTTVSIMNGLAMGTQNQLASDPEGTDYTDTTFDGQKHVWKQSNPHRSGSSNTDGTTTSTFDALGRVTLITSQDGSQTSTSYSGNCTTVTDPASKTRESCSDAMGRLTRVLEDPNGSDYETDYTYNALDKLTQVVQAGSHTRSFIYDSLGRMTSSSNPETGTIAYNYDADGNCPSPNSFLGLLVSRVDARGIRTCMQYDQDNRMTYRSYSDGTLYDYFEYDIVTTGCWTITNGIGRLTVTVAGQNATHLMSYDAMGRILLNAQGAYWNIPNNNGQTNSAYNVNYTYDLAGDVTSVSSGVGGVTNNNGIYAYYSYDNAARPISLTSSMTDSNHPATLATVQNHWPTGAIQKMTYGNGLTGTRAYDNRLQPCRVNVNSSGTALQNCSAGTPSGNVLDLTAGFNYGSGDNGNVVTWSAVGHQNFSRSYGYDDVNRLTLYSANNDPAGCYGLTYVYDTWSNRTGVQLGHLSGTCDAPQTPVDGNNHLLNPPYTTDLAGNLTYDGTHYYAYDAEERIGSVTSGPSYLYNADGMRVSKITGSTATDFIRGYDATELTDNLGPGWSNWQNVYFYLGGQLVAQYTGGAGGTTEFVHQDHLGSTRLLTALNGSVVECDDYMPFGELLSYTGCTNTQTTARKFTSKERDTETNLDYFGARYYTSSLGRFVTSDWALTPEPVPYAHFSDPQTLNLYGYVRNNPLSSVDFDGHGWLGDFLSGVADTTYRPVVQAVSHPLDTAVALSHAVAHPVDTAVAAKNAVVATGKAALSGDPTAIGKVAGTVISAVATAGAAKAASGLVEGAEVGEAASSTSLFRAVDSTESGSISGTGAFTASPTGSDYKGFFFDKGDAQNFGDRMTKMTGDTHTVVPGEAPTSLVKSSPAHSAATEGPGVLIHNDNLPQVKVKPDGQL